MNVHEIVKESARNSMYSAHIGFTFVDLSHHRCQYAAQCPSDQVWRTEYIYISTGPRIYELTFSTFR